MSFFQAKPAIGLPSAVSPRALARFPKDLLGSRGAQLLHLRFCTKKRPYAARAIAGKRALIAKT